MQTVPDDLGRQTYSVLFFSCSKPSSVYLHFTGMTDDVTRSFCSTLLSKF